MEKELDDLLAAFDKNEAERQERIQQAFNEMAEARRQLRILLDLPENE